MGVVHKIVGPDRIGIVYDETGVCDLLYYTKDGESEQLSIQKTCSPGLPKVKEVQFKMTEDNPLIGFHANVKDDKILELGAIWFSKSNAKCVKPLSTT